ncbi:diguanylate cyclase [Meiothermus sp.]|uniref:diguanylate cyclase n=1 Tax=Meiothermus sp. TaxID=1955249 RepID=UPI0021DE0EF2|nr:diguanylate cyclase [Meiothermus sp.]GIW24256.1 MAG: diguanylate cyclase [Meiothermus sp.]
MTLPYPAILALSLVATALVYGLGMEGIYALPWMMFLTATTASVYGLGLGLLAAAASIVALHFFRASPQDYLVMGFILFLSAYLAHQVGESLRRAHRRAKQLAQIQDVFLQGLEVVPRFFERNQLLLELPTLLSRLLRDSRLYIWVPSGADRLELLEGEAALPSELVNRALRERRLVWLERTPGRVWLPGGGGSYELALPLFARGEPAAVLQIVRAEAWRPEEIDLFQRLAQTIGRQLEHLHDLELRRLLFQIADRLAAAHDKRRVAEEALHNLMPALGMEAGVVLQHRQGSLRGIAWKIPKELRPTLVPLARQLNRQQGLAWQAYHSGMPFFTENYGEHPEALPELKQLGFETLVAYPVHTRDAMKGRVVLVLGQRGRLAWTRGKKEILLGVERIFSSALERALQDELHQRINRLLTEAWSYPSQEVYQRILEAAVELVPGSETGSLWIWEEGAYTCRAAVGGGWDCEARMSEGEMLEWYAESKARALEGAPRIRTGATGRAGVGANLCLPVAHQGRVLAYLNLDSQDPAAFAEDSLAAARLFATPIATLVHELQNRTALENAALTDGLTGLYNRRAFDLRLAEEVERAHRYNYPLSLLVMDLKNFKPINDQLGHAAGDRALQEVARVLVKEARAGDMVFRWGGDEFAMLLPQTNAEGAQAVAGRLLGIIAQICVGGLCLSANIGKATFPLEAPDAEALLRLADSRMYVDKRGALEGP